MTTGEEKKKKVCSPGGEKMTSIATSLMHRREDVRMGSLALPWSIYA